jgi:hypothetical protein
MVMVAVSQCEHCDPTRGSDKAPNQVVGYGAIGSALSGFEWFLGRLKAEVSFFFLDTKVEYHYIKKKKKDKNPYNTHPHNPAEN